MAVAVVSKEMRRVVQAAEGDLGHYRVRSLFSVL
jgi:hypothetical protein